jgi:hypothetical protein
MFPSFNKVVIKNYLPLLVDELAKAVRHKCRTRSLSSGRL